MKLSVLIPMYNAKEYIERCLDSLLLQDLSPKDYEIVIIDDGSTDNSRQLVNKYKGLHPNILLFEEPNAGAFTTRNKLLKLARGTYIYCVDADDYVAHNALGSLIEIALEENLDLIGFGATPTTTGDAFKLDIPINSLTPLRTMTGCEFLQQNPFHRVEIWWYLIRREFLEKNNIIFDKNEYNADVLFTFKLFLNANKVAFCPVSIYRYFQSPNSLMRNKDRMKMKEMAENFYAMVFGFSEYINELEARPPICNENIIKHFAKRRDYLLYALIIIMIRSNIGTKTMRIWMEKLKGVNAYPIKNFIESSKKPLSYFLFRNILNREYLLYKLARVFRMVNGIWK